jgi:hypothetical protein
MHLAARRLAGDQDARLGMGLQYRARPTRQVRGAELARPHAGEQGAERLARHHGVIWAPASASSSRSTERWQCDSSSQ